MLLRPLSHPIILLFVAMCIWHLYSTRRKKLPCLSDVDDPLATEKANNLSAMQKVVDEHKDFTAEVIHFSVSGKRRVRNIRLLNPGDELELRSIGDSIKLFAIGEYVSDLRVPDTSQLHILLRDKIPFEAYLGGRDLEFINNDEIDFASLILFYKMDGLSPTKVNLK